VTGFLSEENTTKMYGTRPKSTGFHVPPLRFLVPCFLLLLLVVDWFLYFRHASHFFQADSVWLLDHRATSLSDLLLEFTRLQASGRYRPLSHPVLPSILYPIFGLNPIPYRIPVYAFFLAGTAAVYALVVALSRNRLAAAVATFFFSIHTANAYTTYDVGFMPELLYMPFYIGAVLGYLRYLQAGSKAGYRLSLACFVGSLLSKEGAVTLPAVLIGMHLLNATESAAWRKRFVDCIRSTLPHIAICLVYLIFVVGWLNTINISLTKLFEPRANVEAGSYQFAFGKTVLNNADLAFTWAFNIPRGWIGQWRTLNPLEMTYLKGFRLIVLGSAAALLLTGIRKLILFGIGWFFLTVSPVLPLVNHLMPYYLFLPLAGIALVVGLVFSSIYDVLKRSQPIVAAAALAGIFAGLLYATAPGIREDILKNRLLGGSAELALNSVTDLRRLYPALSPNARIFFNDVDEPVAWDQSWGGLIRMAYNSDELAVRYASSDDLVFADPDDRTIVVDVRNKHLIDQTAEYRRNPERMTTITYIESDKYQLELSSTAVTVGDSYSATVRGLRDASIKFMYRLNEEAPDTFAASLDSDGRTTFKVSESTKKGVYTFLGFTVPGESGWIRCNATVVVR
jgi:hypothetical protein